MMLLRARDIIFKALHKARCTQNFEHYWCPVLIVSFEYEKNLWQKMALDRLIFRVIFTIWHFV